MAFVVGTLNNNTLMLFLSAINYNKKNSSCLVAKVCAATQRAKFYEKVHKPRLRINVNNFELNGFNASIKVPQTPPKM